MHTFPDASADPHAVLARLLPPDALQQTLLILRNCLPAPRAEGPRSLGPEERAWRERAAVAGVVALLPRTAAEGRLAAQFVAADAWAMDCLHLAGERQPETEAASKCRSQAIGMMREGRSALRMLLQLQAARQRLATDMGGAGRAARVERNLMDRRQDALGTPGEPSVPEKPLLPKLVLGRPAAAAGKWQLISNSETKSQGKRLETIPRLTLVPVRPVADPAAPGTKPPGPGMGGKGRTH